MIKRAGQPKKVMFPGMTGGMGWGQNDLTGALEAVMSSAEYFSKSVYRVGNKTQKLSMS